MLEAFGYTEHSVVGSHHTFTKAESRPITVPVVGGRRVKRIYIRRIVELLELEEWNER